MEIYLHLGFPKTGSTAIQAHISSNFGWFIANGVYIPTTGFVSGLGHVALIGPEDQAIPEQTGGQLIKGSSSLVNLKEELASAQRKGFHKALISWEGLALIKPKTRCAVREALCDHKVILLAYVREQSLLYQSATLNRIKNVRFSGDGGLFEGENSPKVHSAMYDFQATLEAWRESFSNDILVRVRIYDKNRLKGGNIVLDFLDWLGMTVNEQFSLQSNAINPSLDTKAAAVLVVAKAAGLGYHQMVLLSRALARLSDLHGYGNRSFLNERAMKEIRHELSDSNKQLFVKFPPENKAPGEQNFAEASFPHNVFLDVIDTDYLHKLFEELTSPSLPVWQGEILTGLKLMNIVSLPNTGWLEPNVDGTCSLGTHSELSFTIPETDSENGPVALELIIAGRYFGENSMTKVLVNNESRNLVLKRSELRIDINDSVRENGVKITLEHSFPALPEKPDVNNVDTRIAFKLEWLSYNFIWK